MKATHNPPDTTATDPDLTPAVLLRGAAIYLSRHGRIIGEFFGNSPSIGAWPPACAIGAINICAHGRPILSADDSADDDLTDAAITAMRVFAASLDIDDANGALETSAIDIVSAFNDDPEQTTADVIKALNDAANEWDQAHNTGGAR